MAQTTENQTEQQAVNPAEELKKAAQAAEQAQGAELPPEVAQAEGDLAAQLAAAQAKAAEHFDLYVRSVAEMENVRRRAAEDVQKAQKFGVEKFAQNLLPVVDSLEKALEITADSEGPMREGLLATHRQLMHALEASGMTMLDPQGEKFDPNFHEAVHQVEAEEGDESGTIKSVFRKGYELNGKILRYAQVVVIK